MQAEREGVELFRVLSNQAITEIASVMPSTKKELLAIKGFKEKKFQKYGLDILAILGVKTEHQKNQGSLFGGESAPAADLYAAAEKELFPRAKKQNARTHNIPKEEKTFTVSTYLDLVNIALLDFKASVKGEVSSCDIRGNYLFFSLKDKGDESVMNCFMWQSNYRISGVTLEEGMEVTVYGFPEVYKARGNFTMRVETITLVGEGALKKAYDVLKAKLEKEGIFAPEKKRPVPDYPHAVGLITSKTGAVIHDFLNNLGKFGYAVQFFDARVEGQLAVKDLLRGVKYFREKDIDALVIIRGGGSLESLVAFNNEVLVREIATFPRPVLCGIGHDKDIPLVSMACDKAASTPTAVTHLLNESWQKAKAIVRLSERDIMSRYGEVVAEAKRSLETFTRTIETRFRDLFEFVRSVKQKLLHASVRLGYSLKEKRKEVKEHLRSMREKFLTSCAHSKEIVRVKELALALYNPEHQLRMGYSIMAHKGKIVRSIAVLKEGMRVDIKVVDGTIEAKVNKLTPNH